MLKEMLIEILQAWGIIFAMLLGVLIYGLPFWALLAVTWWVL